MNNFVQQNIHDRRKIKLVIFIDQAFASTTMNGIKKTIVSERVKTGEQMIRSKEQHRTR